MNEKQMRGGDARSTSFQNETESFKTIKSKRGAAKAIHQREEWDMRVGLGMRNSFADQIRTARRLWFVLRNQGDVCEKFDCPGSQLIRFDTENRLPQWRRTASES
jgi:hypothetical protein